MTFFELLTEAINEFMEHGFDSESRLTYWIKKLKEAAAKSLIPEHEVQKHMEKALGAAYTRLVTNGGLVNKDVSKFTVDKLKPKMRAELDRRIMASAQLITFNREQSINNMLKRFSGWATAIPIGGTKAVDKKAEKKEIRKDLASLDFKERRVIIDQTHKLINNINEIVAVDAGAIGGMWRSNWHQANYNYREDHKERSDKIYLIKGNWASEKGLIKPVHGYTDSITAPGEEVFCRCRYKYIYKVKDLPDEFLTSKGKIEIQSNKSL